MKKAYFLFNPLSGKQTGRDTLKYNLINILDKMTKAGYEVTIRPTQNRLDACEISKKICSSEEYSLIACSGGDGTLNEVIQGIMDSGKKVPVMYMPTGTTNDFATSLGISKNPDKASECIKAGNIFSCDICSFNQRYFTYVAAFGAFTDVVYETPQQYKNMIGHTAYVLEGMKKINSLDNSYHLKLTYNNGQIIEDNFMVGMITNSTSVGGLISTSSTVLLNDGLFEVTLIKKPPTIIEFQNILTALLSKKQNIEDCESKYLVSIKTNELKIESKDQLQWTLDGEFGGIENNITIKNCHKAIDFFINTDLMS